MGDVLTVIGRPSRRRNFPALASLLSRIAETFQPDDVLLFGSRARGDASAESDWDLLVLLPDDADKRLLDPMLGWQVQAGSGVHADIVCAYTTEFIADALVANSLTREIMDDAVLIDAG